MDRASTYPDDWNEQPLEAIAEINPESLGAGTPPNFRFKYIDISSVEVGVINWNSVADQVFETSPSRARRVVRPNDVLLSTVRPALQSHTFANWSEEEGYVCSTGFSVIRAGQGLEPRFLKHLIFGRTVASQLRKYETGSNYPAVPESDVRRLLVPLPSLLEQRRIAEILDAADETIRQTERVIAKLREVKRGLLHDLLTRGLDADGNLRDPVAHPEQFKNSPLGRIPREWEIHTLGELIALEYGEGLTASERTGNGYPVFGSSGIVGKHVDCLVDGPGIVVGRKGTVGAVTWSDEAFWPIDTTYYVVRKETLVVLRWVYELLRYLDLGKLDTSTGVPGLNRHDVYDLQVALPNSSEQHNIATVLDAHDTRIRAEEAVLVKRRQVKRGLMADLLTGRVRVGS